MKKKIQFHFEILGGIEGFFLHIKIKHYNMHFVNGTWEQLFMSKDYGQVEDFK